MNKLSLSERYVSAGIGIEVGNEGIVRRCVISGSSTDVGGGVLSDMSIDRGASTSRMSGGREGFFFLGVCIWLTACICMIDNCPLASGHDL